MINSEMANCNHDSWEIAEQF